MNATSANTNGSKRHRQNLGHQPQDAETLKICLVMRISSQKEKLATTILYRINNSLGSQTYFLTYDAILLPEVSIT